MPTRSATLTAKSSCRTLAPEFPSVLIDKYPNASASALAPSEPAADKIRQVLKRWVDVTSMDSLHVARESIRSDNGPNALAWTIWAMDTYRAYVKREESKRSKLGQIRTLCLPPFFMKMFFKTLPEHQPDLIWELWTGLGQDPDIVPEVFLGFMKVVVLNGREYWLIFRCVSPNCGSIQL